MPSVGPTICGTGADDSGVGTVAWSNPSRVTTEDGTLATAALAAGETSHYVTGTNFAGLSAVPDGAAIVGLVGTVKWQRSLGGSITDSSVKVIVAGAVTGASKATGAALPEALTAVAYGGAADAWGQTLTGADVKASNFGFAFAATNPGAGGDTASADAILATVYYADPVYRRVIAVDAFAGLIDYLEDL